MRVLVLAFSLSSIAGGAFAQDGASFDNPTPINYQRPFLVDGANIGRFPQEDVMLPVQVIGREELLRRGSPTLEEVLRSLSEVGNVSVGTLQDPSERRLLRTPDCLVLENGVVTPADRAVCSNGKVTVNHRKPEDAL